MAEVPKTSVRLPAILLAYLDELASLGAYGKGRSGVMRQFIEKGIQEAIEKKVIAPRSVSEFDEESSEAEEDD